ncbi:MAG: exodeoxyribonuclease III, partial [Phycicoccus sp.]
MRLATWNVNSIRSRIDRVEEWLRRTDVDVLAMQETKARDEQFPYARFRGLGYEAAHRGVNQWNGVAVLSRVGLDDVTPGFEGDPGWGEPRVSEARAVGATCGGIRVWSVYAPNGRALDDPHMAYKLDWLARLREQAVAWAVDDAPLALCGDWNIAPQDDDVWSMEYYLDKSHVSAPERAAFGAFLDAGFVDVVRPHAPGPGVYTYWDYQRLAFAKRRGMRIDF